MAIKRILDRLLAWRLTVWPPALRAQIDKYKRLYGAEQARADRMVAVKAAAFSQAVLYEAFRGKSAFPVSYDVQVIATMQDQAGHTARASFHASIGASAMATPALHSDFEAKLAENTHDLIAALVDKHPPAEQLMRDEGPIP